MHRRDLIKSSLLAAGAFGAPQVHGQEKPQIPERRAHSFPTAPGESADGQMPNILWICSDMQRFDTIEGLNNDFIRTPHLRKLMAEAVTFTHAYAQNPVCAPSRASFLTGRYPHTTALRANGQRIRPDERLVTRLLADQGYVCGLAGKLHLSPIADHVEDRIDDGYSAFHWSHDLSDAWPGQNMWRVWLKDQGIAWPSPPKNTLFWGVPIDPQYTQTAWCSDMAINFMRQKNRFNPWLMSVNIFQPHSPYWPTEEYFKHYDAETLPKPNYQRGELDNKTLYQQIDHQVASGGFDSSFGRTDELTRQKIKAAYYAMIEQIDTEVGRMLEVLEETGQGDNTIVIFMSDHGEMLGDHGIFLKGPYFYEGAIRVPLMLRWRNRFKAGLRSDALTELVDLAPTLLQAAGLPIPGGIQGHSLMPLLTGQTTKHRDSIYCEHFDSSWLYDPPPMASCVRTKSYKLAYYHNLKIGELYDLYNDPTETYNLWNSPDARSAQAEMLQTMVARFVDTVDPLPERKSLY